MKKLILVLTFSLLCSLAFAQKKDWGIGLRGGEPAGLSIKKYLKGGSRALDITLGYSGWGYYRGDRRRYWKDDYYYRGSPTLMINYLWHKPIKGAKGLDIYYGIGGQLSGRRYYDRRDNRDYNTFALGVVGNVGIEWYIPEIPISLFAELNPTIELFPATFWMWINGGGGLRVNF
ncbi:MAG: hypothetical protein MUE85_06420 [Microscillaceae bacterium]|jgi:hypothetical protein|nr:hypothetical protein [Microscillaceae bacterium]